MQAMASHFDSKLLKDSDYVDLFDRYVRVCQDIKRRGLTPELAAAKLELLIAMGDREPAVELAKEMLLANRSEASVAEARAALKSLGVPLAEWDS